jgi:hypothetical protein
LGVGTNTNTNTNTIITTATATSNHAHGQYGSDYWPSGKSLTHRIHRLNPFQSIAP